MTRNRREILDVLASIADGEPVNWDGLNTAPVAPDLHTLRALQIIAGVADLHRSLPADDGAVAEEAPARVIGRIDPSPRAAGAASAADAAWGSFVLRESLGSGTSADVFRAYEPRLDRDVALKLFKPGLRSGREMRARMLREARTLARVRHDHVAQVFGADEHGGRVGIWMELISGRSLEAELTGRGRWSAREAAAAGQDLCRALAAVHNAGFVHGDIKPQNVIREEGGRLVLMDFGARHLRECAEQQAVSGTPLYLAPEILAGGPPSVASDVFSFGVLLYHLVTGAYPVVASSLEDLRERHREQRITRISDARPDLQAAFVRVVERALDSDPGRRFQSAGEMEAALGQVLGAAESRPGTWWDRRAVLKGAAAAVTAVAVAASALMLWRPAPAVPERDSLAVLPFRTVGGQDQAAYLSEGVSADLTSLLARLPGVRMVSGVSVQQFRDTKRPATEIGSTLGVRMLVAGVVQMSGDRISVTAELVDGQTGRQVWSERFDRRVDDLFSAQSDIARSIGEVLRGHLSPDDAGLLARKPMSYRAFELYSLGRYHWNKRTAEGLQLAIDYFEQASVADSSAALPYAGLSDAYVLSGVYGLLPPLEAQRRAEVAALRAVALDPALAEAYAALGSIRQEQLRWPEAEAALVRAIELRPGYSPAHHWYALYLASHRQFDAAIDHMQQAVAQDPLSVVTHAALGFIYYIKGEFPSAIEKYRGALELESSRGYLHRHMAVSYLAAGSPALALEQLDLVPPGSEPPADLNAIRANVYALTGRTAEARALLVENGSPAAAGTLDRSEQAAARLALGDDDLAYQWLEGAVANRENAVQYLAVEPRFQRIRHAARFVAILKQVGLDR